ncbi:unnamed protein product [Heterobilharzia americana]|nr:unnamed protein product [Heterobilharzia americana]
MYCSQLVLISIHSYIYLNIMVCSAERIDDAMTTKSTQDGSSTLPKERSTIGDVEHGSGARDSASSGKFIHMFHFS